MPNTIDVIEKSGKVDSIEVYKRAKSSKIEGGEEIFPEPIYISGKKEQNTYRCSKEAVLYGRNIDRKNAVNTVNNNISRLEKMLEKETTAPAEREIISKIKDVYMESIQVDDER